jgi:hypothetical protein
MEAEPYYFGDAESRSSAQVVEYLAEHEAWRSMAKLCGISSNRSRSINGKLYQGTA